MKESIVAGIMRHRQIKNVLNTRSRGHLSCERKKEAELGQPLSKKRFLFPNPLVGKKEFQSQAKKTRP